MQRQFMGSNVAISVNLLKMLPVPFAELYELFTVNNSPTIKQANFSELCFISLLPVCAILSLHTSTMVFTYP